MHRWRPLWNVTLAASAIVFKFVNMLGCLQSTPVRYALASQSTIKLSKSSPPAAGKSR